MTPIQVWILLLPLTCLGCLVTVETSRGEVQGFVHDSGNDTTQRFYGYGQVFLGIPFAKPPVGERRFSLPVDICRYNDHGEVHNATYYRPRCWQGKGRTGVEITYMAEDCLYLNVITPNISGNYPVMVYVYGGAFTSGGADIYHWKGAIRNLVSRGVVVVTIQYRISLLGFFTTFTENFPPNRGLYDQIMALRWVNEEISNFGGDSSRITLFGQSAGATAVNDLSLSPLARGLFHQLIQQSGSSMQQLEIIDDPNGSIHQQRAQQICQINSTDWGSAEKDQELLNCFQTTDPKNLVAFDFTTNLKWNVAIDGAILPDYPEKLGETRPKYPSLLGNLLDEYAIYMMALTGNNLTNIGPNTNQYLLKFNTPYLDDASAKNFSDTMIIDYSNGVIPAQDDHMGWARLTSETTTDLLFSAMQIRDVQWHRDAGNEDVWLFTFAHRSMLPFGVDVDGWIPVAHNGELPYLWFYPSVWETYNATDADFAAADYLGEMWTDFAKNGELARSRAGQAMNYVEIGDSLTLKSNWRQKAQEVFNEKIPSYLGEYPPLSMPDETWVKLRELGDKVRAKWNVPKCSRVPTTPSESTTSGRQSTQH